MVNVQKGEFDSHVEDYSKLKKLVDSLVITVKKLTEQKEADAVTIAGLKDRLVQLEKKDISATREPQNKISYASLFKTNKVPNPEAVAILSAARNELNESERRKNNLIVFGVKISNKSTDKARLEDDKNNIMEVVTATGVKIRSDTLKSVYRLKTKSSTEKPPPILIEFENTIFRDEILKNAKNLRNDKKFENIFINPDRTAVEREYTKKLLADRKIQNEKMPETEKALYYYGIRNNAVKKIKKKL